MNTPTRKDSLLGQWIHLAIAGTGKGSGAKRKFIVAQDDRFGYVAILNFGDLDLIIGRPAETPDHAALLLESALEEEKDKWFYGHGPHDDQ